ncbi:hypothetical protein PhCBS80983_g03927 [Powellomyces hirtus]|uniref:Peroxisomal biogenesis factor 11 n=1 Tax=Powellomyces hirtus TaxID=109895 RepID=A0A507DZV5_9FUNG|nr:peroxisomal biogenesis factor 11 [Powellomyces hirtus]TPX57313.1 hypothetical protein PhCBS80983_g03927 [Powellomyces hirtus]
MNVLKPNPTLDKLTRFLGSVRGTDKVLMLIQYVSKILIWHLQRTGLSSPTSGNRAALITRILNLAGPVADTRILLRYSGLIPLLQWTLHSESSPAATAKQQFLIRAQNAVNFIYYPLEHAYWLGLHGVIPMTPKTRDTIGIWSCRFWAAYVVLYFAQLYDDHITLRQRERALLKKKVKVDDSNEAPHVSDVVAQVEALKAERKALTINSIINAAYFPLTVHWSLERSSFPDVGVGICGTIAAVAQLYTAWKAA